jgi:hypothetical protein
MTTEAAPKVDVMPSLLALIACLGALTAAVLLKPPSPGAEGLTLAGYPLPPVCAMKRQFDVPCPGCGLTRSWVAAAHGDLDTSLGFHRLGWLVMFYVGLQVVRNACWLAVPASRAFIKRWAPTLDKAILPLGALVILNWILKLAGV